MRSWLRTKPLDISNPRSNLPELPTFDASRVETVGKMPGYPLEDAGVGPLRSRRMTVFPLLARGMSQVVPGLRAAVDAWRHPRSTVRRWRQARKWPRPTDFDRMSPAEFDAYIKRIGFDARITAALAEPIADGVSVSRDDGLATGRTSSESEREGVAALRTGSHSG